MEDPNHKKVRLLLQKTICNDFKEKFVSYDQLTKSKKKRGNEEDSSHLNEIFSKVKDKEKKMIRQIIQPWFIQANSKKHNESFTSYKSE